jgi:hypothetical protein
MRAKLTKESYSKGDFNSSPVLDKSHEPASHSASSRLTAPGLAIYQAPRIHCGKKARTADNGTTKE